MTLVRLEVIGDVLTAVASRYQTLAYFLCSGHV